MASSAHRMIFMCMLLVGLLMMTINALPSQTQSEQNIPKQSEQDTLLKLVNFPSTASPNGELFKELSFDLTKFADFAANHNKREFTITGTKPTQVISEKAQIAVKFDQPIVQLQTFKCRVNNRVIVHTISEDKKVLMIDIGDVAIMPSENFVFSCYEKENLFLDFNAHRNQEITVTVSLATEPDVISSFTLPKIDDNDGPEPTPEVEWAFDFNVPLVSQYQPYLTLTMDNIPPPLTTSSSEFELEFKITGIKQRNGVSRRQDDLKSLHLVTVTSYPDQASTQPTVSTFTLAESIDLNAPLFIKNLVFPENHVKLSVKFEIAVNEMHDTENGVSISGFSLRTKNKPGKQVSYVPQKTTITKWAPNPSFIDQRFKMEFSKAYIGEEKKGDKTVIRGPSFSIIFTNTVTPLIDSTINFFTDSALPYIESSPSFWIDPAAKTGSLCTIPEFKKDLPTSIDAKKQILTFSFKGIEELKEKGKTFTISCPSIASISSTPKNSLDMLYALTATDDQHKQYAGTWKINQPHEPHVSNGPTKILIAIIIVAVVIIAAIIGFVLWKRSRKNDADGQPLLGGDVQ